MTASRWLVPPGPVERMMLGGVGVEPRVGGELTGGDFALIEHPIEPRRLVVPHVHRDVDELSYVLEGKVGFRVGDDEFVAERGGCAMKPRGVMHTFWNPTDEPARLLEVIRPAWFVDYFRQVAALAAPGAYAPPEARLQIGARFGTTHDRAWVAELKARYGLRLMGE